MRIAMVGLGFMGLTHLKGWMRIPGIELGAVSSNDPKALSGDLSSVGGNLGVGGEVFDFSKAEKYSDALECVTKAQVDAVDLCLPTSVHAQVAIAALEAGKHVFVEKPMALDAGECQRMIDAARASGKTLMCAQVLRFFPAYLPLIDGVKQGRFGQMHHVLFRRRCAAPAWSGWLANKDISGGGVFDLLIHDIDLVQWIFGLPETLQSWGHEDLARGVDLLTTQFNYPGFSVTVTGGWHHTKDYPFSMEYTAVGEKGALEFSSAGRDPKFYPQGGGEELCPLPDIDGYQAEIEYFVECCRTGAKPERCLPESSLLAVALTRLAASARNAKGTPVPCLI